MTDHSSQAMSDLQTTLWPFGWQPASRIYFANLGAADQFFETSELFPSLRQSLRPSVGTMSWRLDSRVRLAGHPASLSQNPFLMSSYFFSSEKHLGRSEETFVKVRIAAVSRGDCDGECN